MKITKEWLEERNARSNMIEWWTKNNEITDGSCSTIKSLIPSFKSTINIQPGDLIKSNRICCVDEFLRIE